MGWWRIGNDDVIGDGPADTAQAALEQIAKLRRAKAQQKPALDQLLTALASAINRRRGTLLEDGGAVRIRRLEARCDPESIYVSADDLSHVDRTLVKVLDPALDTLTQEYKDVLQRKPRLSELLHIFRFVLGPEPARYLAIDAEVTIRKIRADLEAIQQPLKRDTLMKDELLDSTIQFYEDRIAQYEANLRNPDITSSDRQLFHDVIAQNSLSLFIARYSRGDDLRSLRHTLSSVVEALLACKVDDIPNPVNFAYLEGYVRALWIISLAMLFEVDHGLLERLVRFIGQGGQDALFDYLLGLRIPQTVSASTLLYPNPYLPLYRAFHSEGEERDTFILQFLKQFYPAMKETSWYDLHLRREHEFFGYWCFALAALVKGLGIPDASFADNYFYPKDLTVLR